MTESTQRIRSAKMWLKQGLLLAAALTIGWWAHGERHVHAASPGGDLQFQMQGSDLLIYSSSSRTLFVYKGADTGNSHLQCTYQFTVTGQGVERKNCEMGRLTP